MEKKVKVEEAKKQLNRAVDRFMRIAIASGIGSLGLFLSTNNFDFADWKQYTKAAILALITGAWQGVGKFVREEYPENAIVKFLGDLKLI